MLYKHINSAALQAAEDPKGQAGEKGVLLAMKRHENAQKGQKNGQKSAL